MSELNNEVSSKENNSAKNYRKKKNWTRKYQNFAEKYIKAPKIKRRRNKEIFTNITTKVVTQLMVQ